MALSVLTEPRHPRVANVIPFPQTHAHRTWSVSPNSGADFTTISDALQAATDGDTIALEAGLYLEETLRIDKAVHLVGPCDPRFCDDNADADDVPYALIVGAGAQVIDWAARGGSLSNIVVSRASGSAATTAEPVLIRMMSGRLRLDHCVLAGPTHEAVSCPGGELQMVRCHVRGAAVGVGARNSTITIERSHIEGSDALALSAETGTVVTLLDNGFEGRTVLRGDVVRFEGNDIDLLFTTRPLKLSGNRVSSLVQVHDFRPEARFAAAD